MSILDFLRFRTNPKPSKPPKGKVDLKYDATSGSLVATDSTGASVFVGAGTASSAATVNAGAALITIDGILELALWNSTQGKYQIVRLTGAAGFETTQISDLP